MEENILTFREWNKEHTKVLYDLNWFEVKVYSFGELIHSVMGVESVKLMLTKQDNELLKIFRSNFDKIQEQWNIRLSSPTFQMD
jgi:hypothetical protein